MFSLSKKYASIWMFLICSWIIIGCCSCRSTAEKGESDSTPVLSEHNADSVITGKEMAEKYMSSFVKAVQQNDFDILSAALPETSSKRLDRAKFSDMQKWIASKLGKLESAIYVDSFRQGALCSYIWKLVFVREDSSVAIDEKSFVELSYAVNVMMVEGVPKIVKTGFVFW